MGDNGGDGSEQLLGFARSLHQLNNDALVRLGEERTADNLERVARLREERAQVLGKDPADVRLGKVQRSPA
eukprot:9058018-Pyramimonas_sp.AAC.1